MKRVLITGAAGFWGWHLAHWLVKKKYQVFGTYHRSKNKNFKKVAWHFLDVTDPVQAARLVRRIRPDILCHLAGQSSPSLSWRMPEQTFSLNTLSTIYLLSAVRQFSPKTRFILTSSIHVYGRSFYDHSEPLAENALAWPEGPYGSSKRLAELACLDFYGRFGLDALIVRPVNCIGPHLAGHFAFSDWCRQIRDCERNLRNRKIKVGNLKVERDFLHIQDGVRAYERVMQKGKAGEIYNLSSGKVFPLRKYAESLIKMARVPVKIEIEKARLRGQEPRATRVSSKKLKRLGWRPEKTVMQGLRELLSEWRACAHG